MKSKHTQIPIHTFNTIIIGSGAAALNAAVNLVDLGQKDIAIVTDHWGGGTSNNAGSDKQTYYKLALSGEYPDSPLNMARDLFAGGSMHGDVALCEAQHSAQAFYHLVQLGVPFPHDRYGGYIGYKTDHDPAGRGTSAGPLTSHLMFKALEAEVNRKKIRVFDQHEVISLLTAEINQEKQVVGAVTLEKENLDEPDFGLVVFKAVNVILATGGPAGMYKTSVYPESQTGSSGLALRIGAVGQNLTESQYGLASIKFRWNLSGSYQQVIPRYVSTDQDGGDEQEFLNDHFPDMGRLATAIFLKGYQWPFDPRKVAGYGSSLIDLLVYEETVQKGRRVFLDYRHNPGGGGKLEDFKPALLSREASDYLKKSNSLQATPIERLKSMNQPAIDLYRNNGIDVEREYLEIAVCAQHNNGGLKGNIWWESNIKHLFPVGEVCGTHGVYRPGGSALNSGQVGSLRAAMYISKKYCQADISEDEFNLIVQDEVKKTLTFARNIIKPVVNDAQYLENNLNEIRQRMTDCGAHVRSLAKVQKAVDDAWSQYGNLNESLSVQSPADLPAAFRLLDICLTHALYLEAIKHYIEKGGRSRGSYIVVDEDKNAAAGLQLAAAEDFVSQRILETKYEADGRVSHTWAAIRPVPDEVQWFETVWGEFRKSGNIY